MAALRRQGLTFSEIGTRTGCSERTARRYVGGVMPQLLLPHAKPEPEADPRALRERLLSEFIDQLHKDEQLRSVTVSWHRTDPSTHEARYGPPSILFLSEAERLLREKLDQLGVISLGHLATGGLSKGRFLRETVGELYWDYISWHRFVQNLSVCETGEDWRPPSERPHPVDPDEDYSPSRSGR